MKAMTGIARRARGRAESGFTLVESMVSVCLFVFVGYALTVAVDVGYQSQRTVSRVVEEGRSLRTATRLLVDDLRATDASTLAIQVLADGNHQIRFMQPIDVAGVAGWGVYDRTLGSDPAAQNQPGWRIQYTVRDQVAPDGAVNKQLVRQILDTGLVVRRERVLADGVRAGNAVPPGFTMVQQGELWEISFSTNGEIDGTTGIREVFHVYARN